MNQREKRRKMRRLKIKNPNFKDYDKKMGAHEKRMKDLKEDIRNLNSIPESKLNKKPCGSEEK